VGNKVTVRVNGGPALTGNVIVYVEDGRQRWQADVHDMLFAYLGGETVDVTIATADGNEFIGRGNVTSVSMDDRPSSIIVGVGELTDTGGYSGRQHRAVPD